MKPRDVFGIVVRTIGLLLLFYGPYLLLLTVLEFASVPVFHQQTRAVDAAAAAIYLVAGLLFLFGTKFVVNASYGRDTSQP